MNLILSNNLKETILTENELITDQIRLKSDHYLDYEMLYVFIIMTIYFCFSLPSVMIGSEI